jgi:hypothetical protein
MVPAELKEKYDRLKLLDLTRGKKQYWIDSAKEMGIRDISNGARTGIMYCPPAKITKIIKSQSTESTDPSYIGQGFATEIIACYEGNEEEQFEKILFGKVIKRESRNFYRVRFEPDGEEETYHADDILAGIRLFNREQGTSTDRDDEADIKPAAKPPAKPTPQKESSKKKTKAAKEKAPPKSKSKAVKTEETEKIWISSSSGLTLRDTDAFWKVGQFKEPSNHPGNINLRILCESAAVQVSQQDSIHAIANDIGTDIMDEAVNAIIQEFEQKGGRFLTLSQNMDGMTYRYKIHTSREVKRGVDYYFRTAFIDVQNGESRSTDINFIAV